MPGYQSMLNVLFIKNYKCIYVLNHTSYYSDSHLIVISLGNFQMASHKRDPQSPTVKSLVKAGSTDVCSLAFYIYVQYIMLINISSLKSKFLLRFSSIIKYENGFFFF